MDRRKSHSSNTFMWGVIVGVILTLLLTTKRGRKILKDLTDGGIDSLEGLFEKEFKTENDVLEDATIETIEHTKSNGHRKTAKRVFRGIGKHRAT